MSIDERCEAEKIMSSVKQHVPKAKLSQQHEAELTFTLPFESMDMFPGQIGTVSVCFITVNTEMQILKFIANPSVG